MKNVLILVFLIIFPINCGGGGGEYYPPRVAVNKIEVKKEDVANKTCHMESRLTVEFSLDWEPNETKIGKILYYELKSFSYRDESYFLGIPSGNFVDILNVEKQVVRRLETPRYATSAAALEIVCRTNKHYLSVYIDQQATSHSSTLYILGGNFDVVYKEHLLGALWMARENVKFGQNLIIASETKWIPKDKWITVGGPWRYKICK